jgi:hypothetical protein
MRVVYYKNKSNICPVKEYFESLKIKIFSDIEAKINYIAQEGGFCQNGFCKPLKGYSVIEIKQRKNADVLIRICYFCEGEMMILLNAFEKPDNYTESRVKKDVDKNYKIAVLFKSDFLKNKKYEEYK